jgi:hypothetical protein
MTTLYWKWTVTTGALLALGPASLLASDPTPSPRPTAAVAAAAPASGRAASVFLPPPAPPNGTAASAPPPGAAAAPAAPACLPGRPLTYHERCKANAQACFLGFPEYFAAPPLGASLAAAYGTHVANGDAARMVLYHYDFDATGASLTLRGRDRLAQIVAMLPCNGFPIVIERTPCDPRLAEKRREMVLNELALAPFPVPPERVLIGPPLANGLSGREAVIIAGNLLAQTAAKGPAVSISSGTVSAPTGTGGAAPGGGGAGGPGGGGGFPGAGGP